MDSARNLVESLMSMYDAESSFRRTIDHYDESLDYGDAGCCWLADARQKLFQIIAMKAVEETTDEEFLRALKVKLDVRLQK